MTMIGKLELSQHDLMPVYSVRQYELDELVDRIVEYIARQYGTDQLVEAEDVRTPLYDFMAQAIDGILADLITLASDDSRFIDRVFQAADKRRRQVTR